LSILWTVYWVLITRTSRWHFSASWWITWTHWVRVTRTSRRIIHLSSWALRRVFWACWLSSLWSINRWRYWVSKLNYILWWKRVDWFLKFVFLLIHYAFFFKGIIWWLRKMSWSENNRVIRPWRLELSYRSIDIIRSWSSWI